MWRAMQRAWKDLKQSRPGQRFQDLHHRRQAERNHWQTPLFVALGLALVIAGAIMLVIPGPGLLAIGVGLAIFARESSWMAKGLDAAEVAARPFVLKALERWKSFRRRWSQEHKPPQ